MKLQQYSDNPFKIVISFHLLIEHLENVVACQTGLRAEWARSVLKEIEPFPELRDGITSVKQIEDNEDVICNLLAELFPNALTRNEIKAVTIPFQDILFNQSQRFKNIISAAGPSFDINIRDFSDHQFYIMSCCIILSEFYGRHFNFSKPLYYDIPDEEGIIKHYRILYNGDFMELTPTPQAVALTPEDIDLLRDNFDDLALWKRMFPAGSWIMKGFALVSLYDATIENAVSALKGTLLSTKQSANIKDEILSVFRSIFQIPDLQIGFTAYSADENKFNIPAFNKQFNSFLLSDKIEESCDDTICSVSLEAMVERKSYYSVSDVGKLLAKDPLNVVAQRFKAQKIKSFILSPVVKNDHLLGIIELASKRPSELNSINANQLDVVMPFIADTIDRQLTSTQNNIRALIQNEYTTIHPSVYWKFKREAIKSIEYEQQNKEYALKEVMFKDVYPLYGQIDIKGSSETRNNSMQLDLQSQVAALLKLIKKIQKAEKNSEIQQVTETLSLFAKDVASPLRADTEQTIQNYLDGVVHPLLKQYDDSTFKTAVTQYFKDAEPLTGDFHKHRKMYETTVSIINDKMSIMLDKWQVKAQAIFPHYYERFKTDGVEHNLYIGASIAPNRAFTINNLYDLRLWQLQVLCDMEYAHHHLKKKLPYPLEVTSLILVFSTLMSIRFRMDEKRFDVDGTYNARFEIVKKRIDKAFIKNTSERITSIGKITIVYSNKDEEREYLTYVKFMQSKKILDKKIEMLEVEDLQGISGLKAMRIALKYHPALPLDKCYNYDDLLKETKAIKTKALKTKKG
ncbi:CBS domain-containing protein [Inquilinus sp. KBS0705]|nr:CBS domain-containing protein [Inquilinus sp. KBS0705]